MGLLSFVFDTGKKLVGQDEERIKGIGSTEPLFLLERLVAELHCSSGEDRVGSLTVGRVHRAADHRQLLVCSDLQTNRRRPPGIVGREASGDHERVRDHQGLAVAECQLQALTLVVSGTRPISESEQRLGDISVGTHLQCLEAQTLPRASSNSNAAAEPA